jgi:hypothetical protein
VGTASDAIKGSIGSLNLRPLAAQIQGASLPLFAIIAVMCVLQAIWLCRWRFACCMYKALAPISIVWNFLLFLLAGIFYLVAVLGSDVCFAPAAAIVSATKGQDQLSYYLNCATQPTMAPPAFLGVMGGTLDTLGSAVSQVAKLQTLANSGGSPAGYGPLMVAGKASNDLNLAASNTNAAMNTIGNITGVVFGCANVDALFNNLFGALCNGTVTAAAGMAQMLIAAAVLMLVQMLIGVDLCCFHPGDPSVWEGEGGAAVSGEGKEAPPLAGPKPGCCARKAVAASAEGAVRG